ncbi:MAG: aminoacyltransferase, partial [Anaerolineales bacterium]|nr:aminoacyltransferase [Anaerolineales bacterium]
MADLELIPSVEPGAWDSWVAAHPSAHILQASAWGDLKTRFGWAAQRVGLARGNGLVAGAQVLFRRLPAGLGRLAYIPRGPLVDWNDEALTARLFDAVSVEARAGGAIALMVEPELPDDPVQCERMQALGFRAAPVTIQPPRTIVVDIAGDEQAVLANMKSKARYNIRLAERKGVTVRPASEADLPAFHDLMATTGERDAFGVHAPAYYEQAYRLFVPRDWARLLLAE